MKANTSDNTRHWIYLSAILTAAIGLRFTQLNYHSLWADELATWWDCWKPTFQDFWQTYSGLELTPPLYFFTEFGVARILPAQEWTIRLLSAFYGVGFVITLYLFAYELAGKSRTAALAAAAFATTSYRAILFAQEARSYSLMLCLAALSGWTWLRLNDHSSKLTGSPGDKRSKAYIVSAAALSYTHVFGVIMVMSQALSTIFRRPLNGRTAFYWLKLYAIIGLAFTPWIYFLATHPTPQTSMIKSTVPWNEIFVGHRELFGSSAVNSIFATLLAIYGIVASPKESRRTRLAVFSWVFLVFYISVSISHLARPIYSTRYYMVALAPMLAAAAAGIHEIANRKKLIAAFCTIAFVLMGLHETVIAKHFYTTPKSEQAREAAQAAVNLLNANPDAALVITELVPFVLTYYFDRFHSPKAPDAFLRSSGAITTPEAWPQKIRDAKKVVALLFTYEDIKKIYAAIPPQYQVSDRQDFYLVSVALFTKLEPPPQQP